MQSLQSEGSVPTPSTRSGTNFVLSVPMQFGYTLYRRVLGYYSGEEDAYDLRKAMPRDVLKKSVIPLDRPVHPHELECD